MDLMNSQFATSVHQAASLFDDLQSAVLALRDHQQLLHQSNVDSHVHLQQRNAEISQLHHNQVKCADVIGQDQRKLNEVSIAAEHQANVVSDLRDEVQEGFLRAADVLYAHDARIRSGPKLPVVQTEVPNAPWWPTSYVTASHDCLPGGVSRPECAPNPVSSQPDYVFPPPCTRQLSDEVAPIAFGENKWIFWNPCPLTIGMPLRPRIPILKFLLHLRLAVSDMECGAESSFFGASFIFMSLICTCCLSLGCARISPSNNCSLSFIIKRVIPLLLDRCLILSECSTNIIC